MSLLSCFSSCVFFFFFIGSFKFSIELYSLPRAHRKIELYLPTWGCTAIVINKDNGSHSAHKQRQTGQEGREGRGVRDKGGERGDRTPWGVLC